MKSWMIVLVALAGLAAGCSANSVAALKIPNDTPGTLLIDAPAGKNRLLVYTWGSPPNLLAMNKIYGSGLTVKIVNLQRGVVYETECGEAGAGFIIDYSDAANNVFRFTDCTYDCRTLDEYVEFVQTTVRIRNDGSADISLRVVLKGEQADPAAAEKWVKKGTAAIEASADPAYFASVESRGDVAMDDFMQALFHLRNMGVEDPDLALASMKALEPKTDGHFSEMLGMYMGEVESVKAIRGK